MEHLRAELEIRGHWDCAKKLPKLNSKCMKVVYEIAEECKRGECFVDPDEVIKEVKELEKMGAEKTYSNDYLKPLVITLTAIVIIQAFALTFLTLDYFKYRSVVEKGLKDLEWKLVKVANELRAIQYTSARLSEIQKLKKDINDVKWELRALEDALSFLLR